MTPQELLQAIFGDRTYYCPTCGREQHPGETCQPGHADDE